MKGELHPFPRNPGRGVGGAFVKAYNRIIGSDDYFLNEFLSMSEEYISNGSMELSKAKNAKDVEANRARSTGSPACSSTARYLRTPTKRS